MNDLIISAAVDGREEYTNKVKGLEGSLIHWKGDVRIYKDKFPDWCTPHDHIPYAFKYDMIQMAINDGYEKIFWLDSSMRLLKDISTLNNSTVTAFHNLGHDLLPYINDTAIKNLNANIGTTKQIWGGAIFFNFQSSVTKKIFNEIKIQIASGSFNDDLTNREGFISHRHDQAVLSWILHKHKVKLLPYGVLASKAHVTDKTYIQYGD